MRLLNGNSLDLLSALPNESVDAIITDPPYSSGGLHAAARSLPPSQKYEQSSNILKRADFAGDTLDQRSWTLWSSYWMEMALEKLKPGGYILSFTDWRQLPATTDALQIAGAIWRGIVTWDKGLAARAPHKGYFRHQAEFIVWGSKGSLPKAEHAGPYPGVIREPNVLSEKLHMTGKPIKLMEQLVQIVPPGGVILDPFMGSGTTGQACKNTGRGFIGIEKDQHYFEVASNRLAA